MGGGSFVGRVVSNRMQKTVVVAVDYVVWQPKLKVYEKRISKHFAHDEDQSCDIGDTVSIKWIPRRSKHKHYNVEKILKKVNVYQSALGAAEVQKAAEQPHKDLSRTDIAEAELLHARQRLQQLQELKAAYEQSEAAAQLAASSRPQGSS
jgi:small subunit ribosomal protein S17